MECSEILHVHVDAFQQKKIQQTIIFDFGFFWPKNCQNLP